MPPALTETTEQRPLSLEEKDLLRGLLARESVFETPATRFGEPYRALVNLSLPRRSNTKEDRSADLVLAGETVYLTAEEAARFNRTDRQSGRKIPVVQRLSGPDGTREESPRVLPRQVSGELFRPPAPEPGSDFARPDPDGSSRVIAEGEGSPEPGAGGAASAAELAEQLKAAPPQDAADLPPRARRRAQA